MLRDSVFNVYLENQIIVGDENVSNKEQSKETEWINLWMIGKTIDPFTDNILPNWWQSDSATLAVCKITKNQENSSKPIPLNFAPLPIYKI